MIIGRVILASMLLPACTPQMSCSSKETIDTVKQIVRGSPRMPIMDFEVDDIRTVSSGSSLECSANITIAGVGDDGKQGVPYRFSFPIQYSVERMDSGGIYVTVFGIR